MKLSEQSEVNYERTRQALKRVNSDTNWFDWLTIGEGYITARYDAYALAGTNDIKSHAYRKAFGEILRKEKIDGGIDKVTRSHLFQVMDNRADIEVWRSKLSQSDRMKLNHPHSVLRKWRASLEKLDKPKPPPLRPSEESKAALLQKRNDELAERMQELEQELEAAKDGRKGGSVSKWEALRILIEESKRGVAGRLDNGQEKIPDHRTKDIDALIAGLGILKKAIRECRKERPDYLMAVK